MRLLRTLHDGLTELGTVVAVLCVAATAAVYTAEVVGRYFFNSPLNWAGDVSTYLLCATTFLALPKVTKGAGHVSITFLPDRLADRARVQYMYAIGLVAGLVCLATAVYIAIHGVNLFEQGVLTTQATQIPKWIIALLACFGLISSGLHLLFAPRRQIPPEAGS
jgi:TRAP-type C4-dicarboxylate transport system permease small subunit